MNSFYTNVQITRDNILVRGYQNGKPFKEKVPYKPTHFIKANKNQKTEYTNLQGDYLNKLDFASISDAKNFIRKYEDMVDKFPIYGYPKYQYNYVSEQFADQEPVISDVSVVFFDIEVAGNHYDVAHKVQLEDGTVTTVGELHYYEGKLVWDEAKSQHVEIEKSSYYKLTGFSPPDKANNPVTAISVRKNDEIYVITTVEYEIHRPEIQYIFCTDEKSLLTQFVKLWQKLDPDIVSGWNITFYDIPYIINRLNKLFGEQAAKKLSPWGMIWEYTEKNKFGKEQQSYHIMGVADLDLIRAYIKFSFKNQESFSLNYIAHVELGEKKTDYSQYESLFDLYLKNPQLFVEYNIQDTDLVYKIEKKTNLIAQIIELAYSAGVNYEDAFTSVLFWEVKIKNKLVKRNIIVPGTKQRIEKNRQNAGAYVKPPIPALYRWVVSFDLDSLYPHLMMQYNISPETLVECKDELLHLMPVEDILAGKLMLNETIKSKIEIDNYAYTPNGCFFRKDIQGILSEMMEEEYALRKQYKKQMLVYKAEYEKTPTSELEGLISKYNNMQMARKIAINAAYGSIANEWFFYYSMELAEAITYSGQLAIQYVSNKFNEYINDILKTKGVDYIIANDTDSCYITLDVLVKKLFPNGAPETKIVEIIEKIYTDKIDPLLKQWFTEFAKYTNAYKDKLSMKIENIASTAIWKAKKRYAMNTWYNEGVFYHEAKLKVTGIEAVSSKIPAICREAIKKSLVLILNQDKEGLYKFTSEFEKEFRKVPIHEVATTSGISDMNPYFSGTFPVYTKGTPMHIRAALLYNYYIKKHNITDVYQNITNGDKLKYTYLKLPNPIKENVIAMSNRLPKEFGLEKYIDYDKQFENAFINPVNSIANIVGWDIQHKESILDFMI